ncbi:hypothetical protein BofuT4_uP050030.1 [Botrytis cinerea T4]|uniref:Uncharacterized protein n=1 Tax=Botryotinia fuckeliana (strain T4) TaxID=999810 RepID=G2XZU8_BOTF4|nr:hypothetical protein BofuT4_uP050030.1 [Botrytis cinerea T4]
MTSRTMLALSLFFTIITATSIPICGENSSSIAGSGSINTGCGVYNFQLVNTTSKSANSTSGSSESGSSKASVVSYCAVTGSVLFGVAAFFGWFL